MRNLLLCMLAGMLLAGCSSYPLSFMTYDCDYGDFAHLDGLNAEDTLECAEWGDPACQIKLGEAHLKGDLIDGIKTDFTQARHWIKKAADHKYGPLPDFYLGVIYEYGLGVEQNTQTAISYYDKAADKRYRFAVRKLVKLTNADWSELDGRADTGPGL